MLKKFIALALVAICAMTFVFAQGDSETKITESNGKTDDTIVINFWHKETGVKGKLFDKYVAEFEASHPGVDVVVTQSRNDAYKEKLPISFSGSNHPDVFFTWGGSWLKSFIDAGHVLPLTDVDTSNFVPSALGNATFDGQVYGLPLGIDIGIVYYNKELFDLYGLEVPETFEELEHCAKVLKENGVIPFVLANQAKWPAEFWQMYLADRIGGPEVFQTCFNNEGKWSNPTYIKSLEMIQDIVKDEWFNPGFNGLAYDAGPGRQLLYTGKCGMMILSNTFVNLMRNEFPAFEEEMGIFPFPTVEGGVGDPTNICGIASPVFSVNAHSKYPELCTEFVEFFTSKEIGQEFANTTGSQCARTDVTSTDPFVNQLEDLMRGASNLQPVYDQTLPVELIDVYLATLQEVFGLTMTPEEAAAKMDAKAAEIY